LKLEYIATNKKGNIIKFYAYGKWTCNNTNRLNARHWIINNLDLSEDWNYKPTGNFKHENNNDIITERESNGNTIGL